MQLSARPAAPPPTNDVASALSAAAAQLGHRPAVTVLRRARRDEQGFRSLAKWTAKGAHLLGIEAGLGPGDRLRLDAPVGWPAAAVCFAAWWLGVTVTDGAADVSVVHEPDEEVAGEAYAIGDAADGSPVGPALVEPWAIAVQAFPDQPPDPQGGREAVATDLAGNRWRQEELLEQARRWPEDEVLGVAADAPPTTWLPALVRPLVTGRPTVVVVDVDRATADAEGVTAWA